MPVFRMYMKIALSKKKVIALYMIIFITIFYAFAQYYKDGDKLSTSFDTKEISISIRDKDESTLSKSFVEYLAGQANIVELEDSEEALKDALFFSTISYAISIPEGFEASFFSNTPLDIETISRPDSTSGMMMIQPINSFLSSIKAYHDVSPTQSIQEISERVKLAFAKETTIKVPKASEVDSASKGRTTFFNFLSYMFITLSMLIGGVVFLRIYDLEIRKRNMVSPVSNLSFNFQITLASMSIAFVIWCIFMVAFEVTMGGLFTMQGLFYAINSILLLLGSMGFAFMVVNLLAGKRNQEDALNGVANIYGLGSSFLCGVFIPQAMIGEGVLAAASFLPNFWYIKANDLLASTNNFDFNSMQEVYTCFGIEILFIIAFFAISLYISKTKATMKEL